MAHKYGASKVVGCECFSPLVPIAQGNVELNSAEECVAIYGRRSTDCSSNDLFDQRRSNLIVTEIFDSELLGEGVLVSISHALQELCDPGAKVIPSSAKIWVQLVECPIFRQIISTSTWKLCENEVDDLIELNTAK